MSNYEKQLEKRIAEQEEQINKLGVALTAYEKLCSTVCVFDLKIGKRTVTITWNNRSTVRIIAQARQMDYVRRWEIWFIDIFGDDIHRKTEGMLLDSDILEYQKKNGDDAYSQPQAAIGDMLLNMTGVKPYKFKISVVQDEENTFF